MKIGRGNLGTLDLQGLLIYTTFLGLVGWSVTTRSSTVGLIFRAVYLTWLAGGSAVVLRRRWSKKTTKDKQ